MASETSHAIYVIAGKERYLAHQACERLQDTILGKDKDLGLSSFEGKNVEPAAVLDELRTLPFLAPMRVVVVDQADTFVSDNRALLEKYFTQPSPTGVLILICETWRRTTRLAKMLGKVGKLIPAEVLKGQALANWVTQQARGLGKTVAPATVHSLIQLVGSDTGRLAGELEKLALYSGSRPAIAVEDIEQLCGPTAEQSIFLINDLIAEGRTEQALRTLDRLLRYDRSAEYSMVGVMAFSLRRLNKARAMLDAGRKPADVLRACGVYPGLAERFMRQVQRFSAPKLKQLLTGLAEVDYANKTGLGNAKLNLESFIVRAAAI